MKVDLFSNNRGAYEYSASTSVFENWKWISPVCQEEYTL